MTRNIINGRMLFDRVDIAELLARDAFAKGAYMLGAEDREIMLK